MPVFKASGHVEQSADGLTETYFDDSNYTDNTDGVTLNNIQGRQLISYNADGSVFLSQAFTSGSLTAQVPVTKDLELQHVNTITLANSSTKVATTNYLSTAFYDISQRDKANQLKCNCSSNKALCSNMTKAREYVNAAINANIIGDLLNAQANIDAANSYINLPVKPCGC